MLALYKPSQSIPNTMSYEPRGITRISTEVVNPPRSNLHCCTKESVDTLFPEDSLTYQPMPCFITSIEHLPTKDGDIKESVAPESNKIESEVPLMAPIVSTTMPW